MLSHSAFIFSAFTFVASPVWAEHFSAKDVLIGQKTYVCKFYGSTADGKFSLPDAKRGEVSVRSESALQAAIKASAQEAPPMPVGGYGAMRVRIRGIDYEIVNVECE